MFNHDFNRLFEKVREIDKLLVEPVEEMNQSLELTKRAEEFSNEINRIIRITVNDQFSQVLKDVGEFKQLLLDTQDDVEKFKVAMVSMGYPPHSDIDIPKLRKITSDYEHHGEEYVLKYIDPFMIQYYDYNTLKAIVEEWEDLGHVDKRLPILRSVIKAHNLKMFEASVPTALSQCEGLVMDAFKIKGRTNGAMFRIALKKLLLNTDRTFSFDDAIHEFYTQKVLVGFEIGEDVQTDISRHAILHGYDIDYGKESTSLKAILLLDHLIKATFNIDDELIKECHEEINKKK